VKATCFDGWIVSDPVRCRKTHQQFQSGSAHARRWRRGIAVGVLGLFCFLNQTAQAQRTGIRAQPPSYGTYNDVTSTYDFRAEKINLNVDNPPLSTYVAIATPPTAQYSFVQTSDGVNLLSTAINNVNGQLLNTLPNLPAGGLAPNPTFGGLVDGRAWNAADVTMQQCFSGGFAWNIQGSLQPSAGVGVANTIPYTFAAAANFNEFSYEAQAPNINAPPNGAGATTALGDFTQGDAWGSWNTAVLPANNSVGRYRDYQIGVGGGLVGGVVQGGDPFTAGNATATWGNTNFFSLPNKTFESPVYASPDPLAAGAINPAAANNSRTMTQVAANPTYAVLVAFSATNDDRFVLDLERQYTTLLSDGIPANHIAVLYGDGTVKQLGSFSSIAAANRQPNFGGLYGAAFTMPVTGAASSANVTSALNGGWAAIGAGLVNVPAGANLYLYVTGHGGSVNVAAAPIATNAAGSSVITTLTLSGPPNPTPTTTLQIASNGPLPASILGDSVMVDGNLLPTDLTADATPFDVSSFIPGAVLIPSLYYYSVSVPQSYYAMNGDGTYSLGLQGSTSDISAFDSSIAAVTMLDGSASLGASRDVDTYTDVVVVPEPSTIQLLFVGSATLLVLGWGRRRRAG